MATKGGRIDFMFLAPLTRLLDPLLLPLVGLSFRRYAFVTSIQTVLFRTNVDPKGVLIQEIVTNLLQGFGSSLDHTKSPTVTSD